MTVKEFITALNICDQNQEIVIQRDHQGGGFSLHIPIICKDGHIGYAGPILMTGPKIEEENENGVIYF